MLLYEAQSDLFAKKISRKRLMELPQLYAGSSSAQINVWRNHAIEPLLTLLGPYLAVGKWHADFNIQDYDDSFQFSNRQDADLDLLWIDSSRFEQQMNGQEWLRWLNGRLKSLRSLTSKPIIVATWAMKDIDSSLFQEVIETVPGTFWADIQKACDEEQVTLLDSRISTLAGTPVSAQAQTALARRLACHWLPGALFPALKAIAVDLDNTLYCGVLGEDGIDSVRLTPGHLSLQNDLKALQERGVFLALISRNELKDVRQLFESRSDFGLRWEDFSVTEISWGEKADALASAAEALRISVDAILFIDDNPGELLGVTTRLPSIHSAFAHEDAEQTRRVLKYYPRLWRWRLDSEDTKRIDDLKANQVRAALSAEHVDPTAYFLSLQASLIYRFDPLDQLTRLTDLCNKTNQFNLAMRRLSHADIADRMAHPYTCMVSVQLKDRLSDSGVIAVIAARRDDDVLLVEELCISCRAMGRNLENTIILQALMRMPLFKGCYTIVFDVQHGPRNQPALSWLKSMLNLPNSPEPGRHSCTVEEITSFRVIDGIDVIEVDGNNDSI